MRRSDREAEFAVRDARSVPFSAWILRIAHNASIDHMRSRRAVPCEEVR